MGNYLGKNNEEILKSILDVNGLTAEQKAVIEKLVKQEDETVFKSSYDKDSVIDEIFEYEENGKENEISDPDNAEEKIRAYMPFWERLFEDLSEYDSFPDYENFQSSVDTIFEEIFEVVDGKVYIK